MAIRVYLLELELGQMDCQTNRIQKQFSNMLERVKNISVLETFVQGCI